MKNQTLAQKWENFVDYQLEDLLFTVIKVIALVSSSMLTAWLVITEAGNTFEWVTFLPVTVFFGIFYGVSSLWFSDLMS